MNGLLKFITCGSVDDGKSTLIGHILYDAKLLYTDQEEALVLDSKVGSRGGAIDYSLLLDGLMAEREQGITIDVAYRYFTTDRRSFIVADTPGHEEYTRNMAVGASFAQLAVVMVDARQGVLVQTRRHARICALMGIRYFVFAVNKMDLVDYSEARFGAVEREIRELAAALKLYSIQVIPVSATEGDNVTQRSAAMGWYDGPTLLSYLEEVDVSEVENTDSFYLPVQRVCRPDLDFRGFQGQIEKGSVKRGQTIHALPSKETAIVQQLFVGDQEREEAASGQAVTICLDREVDVSRGCVLTDDGILSTASDLAATLLWMDDAPLSVGKEYLIKLGTKKTAAVVTSVEYRIDVNTGEHISASREPDTVSECAARALRDRHPTDVVRYEQAFIEDGADSSAKIQKNEIAYCNLSLTEPVVVDSFKRNKTLGELILIDRVNHSTAACGVVEEVRSAGRTPYFVNGDIQTGGYIFEEFYFHLENAFLSKEGASAKTYHVGDEVPLQGDSYQYPAFFDIIALDDGAAILIRDGRVQDILPLDDYSYHGLPLTDERGFALTIRSAMEYSDFLKEYHALPREKRREFHNKWSRFETYRRIVCNENFWTI